MTFIHFEEYTIGKDLWLQHSPASLSPAFIQRKNNCLASASLLGQLLLSGQRGIFPGRSVAPTFRKVEQLFRIKHCSVLTVIDKSRLSKMYSVQKAKLSFHLWFWKTLYIKASKTYFHVWKILWTVCWMRSSSDNDEVRKKCF